MITKRKYPWVGIQDWKDVVFLHWPIDPEVIRPYIPSSFQLDLFDDKAWISVVFFQAQNTRGRGMPMFLRLPNFSQLNVRTYVYHEHADEAGVYFLDIYANSLTSIFGAKKLLHLPFQHATFEHREQLFQMYDGEQKLIFSTQYKPETKLIANELSSFLTERYCIWNIKGENIIKIPIVHKKWTLEHVKVNLINHQLLPNLSSELTDDPFVSHFHRFKHTVLFPYEIKGKITNHHYL